MEETFGDLPCVTGIADDIVVYGYNNNFSNHTYTVKTFVMFFSVLVRLAIASTWTNVNYFRCTQIPLFGHIIGAEGLNLIRILIHSANACILVMACVDCVRVQQETLSSVLKDALTTTLCQTFLQ